MTAEKSRWQASTAFKRGNEGSRKWPIDLLVALFAVPAHAIVD